MINEILASWKQDDIRSIEELKEYFRKKVEND
jgi:DNA replication protein DnaD